MRVEQIARLLEKYDWTYPATVQEVDAIIEHMQRKFMLTEGENRNLIDNPKHSRGSRQSQNWLSGYSGLQGFVGMNFSS